MAEIHETEVVRDTDGRVVGYKQEIEPHRSGGFGWGLILGALIIAIGIGVFAYNQGSFETAGIRADHVTAQAQQQVADAAHDTAGAVNQAGDNAQQAANQNGQRSQ